MYAERVVEIVERVFIEQDTLLKRVFECLMGRISVEAVRESIGIFSGGNFCECNLATGQEVSSKFICICIYIPCLFFVYISLHVC